MFPEWTWVCGLFIGAAIGSFLNVVIYRMPLGLSLSNPKHSFCPSCKNQLRTIDLIPLLSWLFLRGKCRQCGSKVPARYFFVELITGGLWAAFWWQDLIVGWDVFRCVAMCLLSAALVAAIYIDLRWFIIPDQVNAFMLLVGIAYGATLLLSADPRGMTWGIPSFVAGALVGFGVLWLIAFLGRVFLGKDAMGHGDIKMARGIGAVLFPMAALLGFGLAVVLGAVFGIFQILLRRRSEVEVEAQEDPGADFLEEEPESIGSLMKCGLGYVLCIDVIGLFVPRLYEWWFGEDPFAVEEADDEPEVGETMIPFGPYLAVGALISALFFGPLSGWLMAYWRWATHADA